MISGCQAAPSISVEDAASGQDIIPPLLRKALIGGEVTCRWEKQQVADETKVYRAYYESRPVGTTQVTIATTASGGPVTMSVFVGPEAIVDFSKEFPVTGPAAYCVIGGSMTDAADILCNQNWDQSVDLNFLFKADAPGEQYLQYYNLDVDSATLRSGSLSVDLYKGFGNCDFGCPLRTITSGPIPAVAEALRNGQANLEIINDGKQAAIQLSMALPQFTYPILNRVVAAMVQAQKLNGAANSADK
ncbi:MAG: hypothetical protein WAT93_01430 [Pontixanthobacter sp.]